MTQSTRSTPPPIPPGFRGATRLEHGGALGLGRRKGLRPIDGRKPLHVVLRSSRARGEWSMLAARNERRVKHLVHWAARRHAIRVFRYRNAGNQLHLVLHARRRESYQNYLRTLAGLLARAMTGAKKGARKGRFWDALAWSRVVEWSADFTRGALERIARELESAGAWNREWSRPPPRPDLKP